MPYFNIEIKSNGPLIFVYVGPTVLRIAELVMAGMNAPDPVMVPMLIDTGATPTALDRSLVERLALVPKGPPRDTHTPGTEGRVIKRNMYDVKLAIATDYKGGRFELGEWEVTECDVKVQGFDGLYGRDILARSHLSYSGSNGICQLYF